MIPGNKFRVNPNWGVGRLCPLFSTQISWLFLIHCKLPVILGDLEGVATITNHIQKPPTIRVNMMRTFRVKNYFESDRHFLGPMLDVVEVFSVHLELFFRQKRCLEAWEPKTTFHHPPPSPRCWSYELHHYWLFEDHFWFHLWPLWMILNWMSLNFFCWISENSQ